MGQARMERECGNAPWLAAPGPSSGKAPALAPSILVWSASRLRAELWRGNAGLIVEVFAIVVAAAILTRYAAVPVLQ